MSANPAASLLFRSACIAGLFSLAFLARAQAPAPAGKEKPAVQTTTSRDGTRIAYVKRGRGPAVILVNGALADRSAGDELAQLLASHFTVYCYDRRGRGDSTDNKPYSVQREVDDIEALVDSAGGSAHVYGKSSGAALALQAAAALGPKVRKLALYEAPYDETEGAAAQWRAFRSRLDGLLAADRRADAVSAFMQFVGAPAEALAKMKASPAWPGMVAMAPTLAYDNAVLGDDRSVPVGVAARATATTLVMDGAASAGPMPFMHATADKLGQAIPGAQREVVPGQAHDVSAKALAPILLRFFG